MISVPPSAVELDGDAWWVYADLADGDVDLVIPKARREDDFSPKNPIAGGNFVERCQLVILGFAYDLVPVRETPTGFKLQAEDGSSTHTIYAVTSDGSETGPHQNAVNCYIKLNTADAATPADDPAKLVLDVVASTVGHITVWGIHRSGGVNKSRDITGSPAFEYT